MKKVNEVFFGEHGLTSTSANHLANFAAKNRHPDGVTAYLR